MSLRANKGITLADTLIVVAIMAMFAAIALPSYTSSTKYQLDLAVEEIVSAIRFSRSEALRTGNVYGVNINRVTKQFTIYKTDLTTVPITQEFVAYHPINKNLYDYNLVSDLKFKNIEIANSTDPFLYTDSVRRNSLLFTASGLPVWIDSSSGAIHQLQEGNVQLTSGNRSQNLLVEPFSGRVTVQ